MRNWSGTVEYQATGFEEPRTVEQLQEVVARAPRIRALGTRHSFNAIADTDGVLVTTTGIAPEFELDEERRVVRLGSGVRREVALRVLPTLGETVDVRRAELGSDLLLIGAAEPAFARLLSSGPAV